ncbi:PfkB family carbohydrate kinase [Mesorhizobium sp. SP-1A]|uniref:PfkB family carbohydrate kinase n=1 Tax=Mesorhizobium sp. SP-1A TaxID=3077840 RepID=UPI0028F74044|nr:PfkB family carbohydrate kinase [Mesorhizobium sp. SP-1A]
MKPLAVIGNVNVDLIVGPVVPWPTAGTEISVDHDELRVGGQAGNSALTWEALGVDYEIAANTGSDEFGRWLRESFGRRAEKWPVRPEGTTLSVGITHPDGERTFFTTRGHLPRFALEDVLAVLDGTRLSGGYALLTAAFLTDDLTARYGELFDWADRHAVTVALDTGWPPDGWTQHNRDVLRGWLSRCGCALLNEVEATGLSGIEDTAQAAREIHAGMPQGAILVVKCGPAGALAVGPDGVVASADAPKVKVVDTIGAGDVFNAAFLAALADGLPLAGCLAAGTRVASRAISTLPRSYGGKLHGKDE